MLLRCFFNNNVLPWHAASSPATTPPPSPAPFSGTHDIAGIALALRCGAGIARLFAERAAACAPAAALPCAQHTVPPFAFCAPRALAYTGAPPLACCLSPPPYRRTARGNNAHATPRLPTLFACARQLVTGCHLAACLRCFASSCHAL